MDEQGTGGGGERKTGPVQLTSGIAGLDRLLNGGLLQGGLHVVLGASGTGKSVLSHQIGAHMIRSGGKVLYLTSLVESHQSLLAQARTFEFFDPRIVPTSFYYASLYPTLHEAGLKGARAEISRLVAHHSPTLVVLDGVHALKAAAEDRLDYQRFIHELEAQSAITGLTTLLLAHPPEGGLASDPTFTIADAIFHMRMRTVRLRQVRMFCVGKLRGVHHIGGWHTFLITGEGIRIYPRVESLVAGASEHVVDCVTDREQDSPALGTGVAGLDEMLGGGLDRDSTTLVIGTPGSGKTLTGLAFLTAGAEAGEPGLLLGYHEPPRALVDKGDSAGLAMRDGVEKGLIHLCWRAPAELFVDGEIERLLALVDEHGIRRVVIDALEDIRHSVLPRSRELSVIAALTNLLRERGITTIVLQDLQRIVGVNFDMPMAELSATVDNVLHLRYVERKGLMKRLIAILKVRAREHDHALRELHISPKGLKVGKAYDRSEMALTGLALPR